MVGEVGTVGPGAAAAAAVPFPQLQDAGPRSSSLQNQTYPCLFYQVMSDQEKSVDHEMQNCLKCCSTRAPLAKDLGLRVHVLRGFLPYSPS